MQLKTINTPCGEITGTVNNGLCFFRGIPYATAARFEDPIRITKWDNSIDATKEALSFPQEMTYRSCDDFYYKEFRSLTTYTFAENPLTLNITSPENMNNCPVVVYIHGGGFENGSPEELPYASSTVFPERGIVYVSIAYRLNVFGLFRSRNYGLRDQAAAVLWVKENIASFGGNPNKITLMGQSAGAMSVMNLCYSEVLKGIVSGAIMLSGGGVIPKLSSPWTEEQSRSFWDGVRDLAGAETDEELKTLPAEKLWSAWFEYSRSHYNLHAAQPGIDGMIIPDLPQKIRKQNGILDIPMLLGVTSQDFMPVVLYEIAFGLGKWSSRKGRRPVYCYLFDRPVPGLPYRAFHESDLWFVFGTMDKSPYPFTDADYSLSSLMADYLANFIRSGDPNSEYLPEWLPISRKNHGFRHFDGISEGYAYPSECRRLMFHTMLRDKGPM